VEDRDELLSHYRSTREDFLRAIDGLSDGQMSDESLDGWSVKDHLLHIALWDEIRAAEVRRISAGYESAWRMADDQVDPYIELAYQLRRGLTGAQAMWELGQTREALLEAIAAAAPRALEPSNYGEAGLRSSHEVEHAGWIRRWRSEKGI
jgi:hypothetical protein